jgi:hypothetical protein
MTTTDNVSREEFDKLCKQVDALSKSKPVAEKRTRKPSEFNLYVGDKIKELKVKDPKLSHRDAFSKAVESWNKTKKK